MASGAENQAGIEVNCRSSIRNRIAPLPFRNHIQPIADGEGLVILLPVVGPVLFLQGGQGDFQGAAVRLCAGAEAGQSRLQFAQPCVPVLVVGEIAFHPVDTPALLLQLFVHLVPAVPVFVGKLSKICLFLYHQSGDSHGGEIGADRFNSGCGCIDGHFQPNLIHICFLAFLRCNFILLYHEAGQNERALSAPPDNARRQKRRINEKACCLLSMVIITGRCYKNSGGFITKS